MSSMTSLTREIHHHRRLHHPHICQLLEVLATESHIWLVTELCAGGELFDYLVEKGRLTEVEGRRIFGELCLAVGYMHDKGVVHRDLKLENVLLDGECRVKLGDLGFVREWEQGRLLETFCGTTGYASPEMLQGKKYTGEGASARVRRGRRGLPRMAADAFGSCCGRRGRRLVTRHHPLLPPDRRPAL
jgi:serine/threonine protein kinase